MKITVVRIARHFIILTIAAMILFSSSIPVYASHIKIKEPTADEKRLFDKILARLASHSNLMKVQVGDVERSFSEPVKISFPCRSFSPQGVDSVSVSVKTQFTGFDPELAEKHTTVLLGGMYVWDCAAVKDRYTLTIECSNMMMLNPSFMIKEETETDEKKTVATAENEMTLYHEFLHGELMIDAMKDLNDSAGWRKSACSFFANNNNKIDYGPSDGDHKIISNLELDYLAKATSQNGGKLILTTIKRENVGRSEFTQVVATFDELGAIAKRGFFVFARVINMKSAEIVVSEEKRTVSIKGSLEDPGSDGAVRLFVLPKTGAPNIKLDLSVDDALKSIDSEFVFTVRLQNQQSIDTSGTIRLGIDGSIVADKDVNIPANGAEDVKFVWKSNDMKASKHIAKIDGFGSASNEVTVFTFDRLQSKTVRSGSIVTDQIFADPDTNERISVARPSRISGTIIIDDNDNTEVRLTAPDGTAVIGKNALVSSVESRAHIVTVAGETLVVKYTELNERLWFFAVKTALSDVPLPSGEWSIRAVDSDGNDANTRIRYYVSYIGNILHS